MTVCVGGGQTLHQRPSFQRMAAKILAETMSRHRAAELLAAQTTEELQKVRAACSMWNK